MKRVKVITSNVELEEFLARTDIEIINVDVRSCEQSWFAQEYFTAAIYYDDKPKSEYNPDYWTRLEHQAAIAAMQRLMSYVKQITPREGRSFCDEIVDISFEIAHALVEKYKEKEK